MGSLLSAARWVMYTVGDLVNCDWTYPVFTRWYFAIFPGVKSRGERSHHQGLGSFRLFLSQACWAQQHPDGTCGYTCKKKRYHGGKKQNEKWVPASHIWQCPWLSNSFKHPRGPVALHCIMTPCQIRRHVPRTWLQTPMSDRPLRDAWAADLSTWNGCVCHLFRLLDCAALGLKRSTWCQEVD